LKNNVRLRILIPVDNQITQIIKELKKVISALNIVALMRAQKAIELPFY
jgi:hypothetical protein